MKIKMPINSIWWAVEGGQIFWKTWGLERSNILIWQIKWNVFFFSMFLWCRCEVDYLSQNFEEVQNIEMRSSPNSQKSGFQLECWYWTWFCYFKCIFWGFTNHDNRIADLKVARNCSHVKYTSAWDRDLAKSCCKKNAKNKVRAGGFSQ